VTFQIGDKVIYPNHGLGIVEGIEEKTILGTTCGFYHLRIAANDTTVLVPLANVDGVGLRRAINDGEVDRLFKLLGDGQIDSQQNWKGRFKDNSEKMRTGSIYDVADVLKSLTLLAKSKSLSFREKRMLDRARYLIITEVSEVTHEGSTSIEGKLDQALDCCLSARAKTKAEKAPVVAPAVVIKAAAVEVRLTAVPAKAVTRVVANVVAKAVAKTPAKPVAKPVAKTASKAVKKTVKKTAKKPAARSVVKMVAKTAARRVKTPLAPGPSRRSKAS
jgi:CarD family transcriptional regulator